MQEILTGVFLDRNKAQQQERKIGRIKSSRFGPKLISDPRQNALI
jgi:hypothetical protein